MKIKITDSELKKQRNIWLIKPFTKVKEDKHYSKQDRKQSKKLERFYN